MRFILQFRIILSFFIALAVFPFSIHAEERNSYEAAIRGLAHVKQLLPAQKVQRRHSEQKAKRIRKKRFTALTAFIPGEGRVKLEFNTKRLHSALPTVTNGQFTKVDDQDPVLLQGRVTTRGGNARAAGSIYWQGDDPIFRVAFISRNGRKSHPTYYSVTIPLNQGENPVAKIQKRSRFSEIPGACPDDLHSKLSKEIHAEHPTTLGSTLSDEVSTSSVKVLTLSLDGDTAWSQTFGSSANATMASYVNEAEVFYETQFGIAFNIVRQNVFSSRTFGTSTEASDLLSAYQCYTSGVAPSNAYTGCSEKSYYSTADAHHLFTGMDMTYDGNSGIIGLAYVGVICKFPTYSFGVTENTSASFVPITFAHELGHNFNGEHTSSGIMTSSLGVPLPESFSSTSVTQINGHLNSGGNACLSTAASDPDESDEITDPGNDNGGGDNSGGDDSGDNSGGDDSTDDGSGGGSGGGSDTTSADVTLQAEIASNGTFSGSFVIDSSSDSCEFTLLGSPRKKKAKNGDLILSSTFAPGAYTFSSTIDARVKKRRNKKAPKGYLVAKISCSDGQGAQSSSTRIQGRLHKIDSANKVSTKQWLNLLATSFQGS